jgi:hypothetical protein
VQPSGSSLGGTHSYPALQPPGSAPAPRSTFRGRQTRGSAGAGTHRPSALLLPENGPRAPQPWTPRQRGEPGASTHGASALGIRLKRVRARPRTRNGSTFRALPGRAGSRGQSASALVQDILASRGPAWPHSASACACGHAHGPATLIAIGGVGARYGHPSHLGSRSERADSHGNARPLHPRQRNTPHIDLSRYKRLLRKREDAESGPLSRVVHLANPWLCLRGPLYSVDHSQMPLGPRAGRARTCQILNPEP